MFEGMKRGLRKDWLCISHHRQESLPTAIAAVDPQRHNDCVLLKLLTCRIRGGCGANRSAPALRRFAERAAR
jgi:hypothetical protein